MISSRGFCQHRDQNQASGTASGLFTIRVSHASKVTLKILNKPGVNRDLPDVQARFRKGRGTRDQIANIRWIMKKARELQKTSKFCKAIILQ